MSKFRKFDVNLLKGKLGKIRNWFKEHHFPPKVMFIIMGIISSVWFLARVIPKPSRATYPCMRVAAPFMSAFIIYLLSLGGAGLAVKKSRSFLRQKKYLLSLSLVIAAIFLFAVFIANNPETLKAVSSQSNQTKSGPDDLPNHPFGKAAGIFPGRVVWIWNPDATNENCVSTVEKKDWYFKPENINEKIVGSMFRDALVKLTGKRNVSESWNALFQYHNKRKNNVDKGYTKGEKIFIKINQGTSRWLLTQEEKDKGYYIPESLTANEGRRSASFGTTETHPYIVLEILRELVNELGIDQADIAVGDPMTHTWGHNYDLWVKEFPNVKYTDKFSAKFGRTLITPSTQDLIFYSDKTLSDKLYDIMQNADYLVNLANLKPHISAGVSLTAKNHFGSIAAPTAGHLHYSHVSPRGGVVTNGGYRKYRVLVDLMGSKYMGLNTVLFLVDGLFGGGSSETKGPVKYFMPPFNNDWSSSIFMSLDDVAIQSVCYDFLRTEWDGTHKHGSSNNGNEQNPNWYGVDDFLHQAADPSEWPAGIVYDPDNSGKPLTSLGVHEHWNNPVEKQYSRNLGTGQGIELVSVPENLVKNVATNNSGVTAQSDKNVTTLSLGEGLSGKSFHAVVVDDKNVKWFLTEAGIVSFDGKSWALHNKNRKVSSENLKDLAFETSSYGRELWLATPQGATVATLPVDARTGATTYYFQNSQIVSENVVGVAIGKDPLRWIGTDKGVSAFYNRKWLKVNYTRKYPADMFKDFPITAMAASSDGDSLFVATEGAGVARFYRDKTDAISGASEYAQWGPINMPSDKVYSICLTPDDSQWFGTDAGIARHQGHNTLTNWTVYSSKDGLVNDFVQAIAAGKDGTMWFGTKGGVSMFDGKVWKSYTEENGLNSNNVLCIIVDKTGTAWLGTDKGVTSINNGKIIRYE